MNTRLPFASFKNLCAFSLKKSAIFCRHGVSANAIEIAFARNRVSGPSLLSSAKYHSMSSWSYSSELSSMPHFFLISFITPETIDVISVFSGSSIFFHYDYLSQNLNQNLHDKLPIIKALQVILTRNYNPFVI